MASPDLSSRTRTAAVKAVERILQIDRQKCRRYFEQNFTSARMAQDYLNIYQRLIQREPASINILGRSAQLDETSSHQYYIAAKSSPADDRAGVLKYGKMFCVFDRFGDIQTSGLGEEGLFFEGTRHLVTISHELMEFATPVAELHDRDKQFSFYGRPRESRRFSQE